MAEQLLHLVFGGRLVDPQSVEFQNTDELHIVGIYPSYDKALVAWKAVAQQTVDDAHMRYFIANIHRLLDEENDASASDAPA